MNDSDKRELKDGYVQLRDYVEGMCTERHKRIDDKFTEQEKALNLAREQAEKAKEDTKREFKEKTEKLNEHQRNMKDLESTFATKEALNATNRLVYIGLGFVLALEFYFKFFAK